MLFLQMLNYFIGLLTAIIGFNFIIFIHEFGHFLFCKIFGVRTPVFSIGMGKAIAGIKLGSTLFQLSALPIGGYVAPYVNDENKAEPGNLYAISYWKRMTIILAGIIFNFVGAFGIYSAVFYFKGIPNQNISQIIVKNVSKEGPAFGFLQDQDIIIGLNNFKFAQKNVSLPQYLDEIATSQGSSLLLEVLRNEEKLNIEIDLPKSSKSQGVLKISFQADYKKDFIPAKNFFDASKKAFEYLWNCTKMIAVNNLNLIRRLNIENVAGPVSIIRESFNMASTNFINFLLFLAFLSINLALINVLPFGILDGGKALMMTLEAIAGRPLYLVANILDLTSLVFLGGITIFLLVKELAQLSFSVLGLLLAAVIFVFWEDLARLISWLRSR